MVVRAAGLLLSATPSSKSIITLSTSRPAPFSILWRSSPGMNKSARRIRSIADSLYLIANSKRQFYHRGRREHRKSGLPGGIDVGGRVDGQAAQAAAVGVHHIEVGVA